MARVVIRPEGDGQRPVLDVVLSERNLIVLLSKLYTPLSARTLLVGDVPKDFDHALLRIEPDELHYASRTRQGAPPGPMHPVAEYVHAVVRDALAVVVRPRAAANGGHKSPPGGSA